MANTEKKKFTNHDYFEMFVELINDTRDMELDGYEFDMMEEFCRKQLASLEHKSEVSRAKNAAKPKEPDTVIEVVFGAITDEFETKEVICNRIGDPEITVGKVQNRINKLVKEGRVQKKTDLIDGHMVTSYSLAG